MTGQKILVVDDEAMVLDSVRMTLSHYGHSVRTASSGSEALALLAAGEFAAVVTDQRMPGMNGDQLAAEIKRHWPTLPVILLTGFPPDQKPAGVDVVLLKPFSTAELRSTISSLTTRRSTAEPGQVPREQPE